MPQPLGAHKGGFLRPFGCGWFIREFLMGHSPHGADTIEPSEGAPQTDINAQYKEALRRYTAMARAVAQERKENEKAQRAQIDRNRRQDELTDKILSKLSSKSVGSTYHSFAVYFGTLKKLGWVEKSGVEEPSAMQDNYPDAPPRIYYRLTAKGMAASDDEWAHPFTTLYPQWKGRR